MKIMITLNLLQLQLVSKVQPKKERRGFVETFTTNAVKLKFITEKIFSNNRFRYKKILNLTNRKYINPLPGKFVLNAFDKCKVFW